MSLASKVGGAVLFSLLATAAAQAQSQIPSGTEVVTPKVYLSMAPVGRGGTFEIGVMLKIRPGFHINAREKSAEYLIATDVQSEMHEGFEHGTAVYPKGTLQTFAFSKIPLNVYQGNVLVRLPMTVQAASPLGNRPIKLKLRYQACSAEVCLPPVTMHLDTSVEVVGSASAGHAAHQEIFGAPQ